MKRGPSPSGDWPVFDSSLLAGIAQAFALRRKAIHHKGGIRCEREFDETADRTLERINLHAHHLTLSVWADGQIFFGVAVRAAGSNKSWTFKDHFYGHTDDVSPPALVRMFEATLALSFDGDAIVERERLRKIWARVSPHSG